MKLQKRYIKIAKEFVKRFERTLQNRSKFSARSLKRQNLAISEAANFASVFIQTSLEKDKNIAGITLSGGVSRGTGDIYSEIDINFYVYDLNKIGNLPPKGDINVNGVWFEFKFLDFNKEIKKEWSMVDKWDGKYAKILFDRNNKVLKLIREKTEFDAEESKKLIKELYFKFGWCVQLAELFEVRGDLKNAHLLINESLGYFVDYCFIINKEFIPYFKWKYYYFSMLKKPSNSVKKIIFDAFLIKDYSKKELHKRIDIMKKEIIQRYLGDKHDTYHVQDIKKANEFLSSLNMKVKYESPW